MTSHPSTSLFLTTGLRPCLVSLRMLSITYFSRWRHERIRSSNKLSADTVLRAHSKNTRSFIKMSSSVELQPAASSFKSKVWKDFGFKVLYDAQGVRNVVKEIVICSNTLAQRPTCHFIPNDIIHRVHRLKRVQVLQPPPQVSQNLVRLNCFKFWSSDIK